MHPVIITLLFLFAVTVANPVISVDNKESNNELFRNDPSLKADEKFLENVNSIIRNAKSLEDPLNKDEPEESRSISSQFEGRKKKIKKIKKTIKKAFLPILIFILVKAIILIPLALAILGFKAWNALQLSFVSFVTGLGLAIWKFCTKVSHDDHVPVVHSGWELDRGDNAHLLAYSGYVPQ